MCQCVRRPALDLVHVWATRNVDDCETNAVHHHGVDRHDESRVGQLVDAPLGPHLVQLRANQGITPRHTVSDADNNRSATSVGEASCRFREIDQCV